MSQNQIARGVATNIRSEAGRTVIRYHNTDVVSFDEKEIILDTGGWFTATTKTRMNQASNQFDLGYYVSQKDGAWSVKYNGKTLYFSHADPSNYATRGRILILKRN